ncbi:ribosomal protein L4 [Wolffia australiana]
MAMASSSASLAFLSSSIFNGSPKGRAQAVPCKTLRATRVARPCQGVRAELATLPVLSFSGEKVGEAALDLRSAPPETARAVVHRGLVTHLQNKRRGTASTLTRAEVRGGGRKPYPQKKTGGARRGSQRTPLRPGGGVIFGPQPKDWTIKMNRKEKRLALSTAIANATSAAFVLEDFGNAFDKSPKTKEFVEALKRWGLDPAEKVTVLATEVPENVFLSCRNIGTVKVLTPRTLNLYDVLDAKNLIFTRSALEYLNSVYGEDSDFVEDEEEDEEGQGEEEDGDVNGS